VITIYDKLIIAFYFVFILAVGLIFRRLKQEHIGLLPLRRGDAVVDYRH